MLKRLLFIGLVAAAMAVAPAQAGPITGSLSFGGAAQPWGGTNWDNATGIDFLSATVASSPLPTGTYLGTQGEATLFNDFTFNPFPDGGVKPLWTFTQGGITYSFDYLELGNILQVGNDISSGISLMNGTGMLYATGYEPTPGLFNLTAQGFGALGSGGSTFSFSASNMASVPDPGSSMLLLGIGLTGVATARRRMKK